MTEFLLLLISTVLVNNFVLVKFLGLCPFMGVSGKLETAIGMSLATTFVLTLASLCSYLVDYYLLAPLDLRRHRAIVPDQRGASAEKISDAARGINAMLPTSSKAIDK